MTSVSGEFNEVAEELHEAAVWLDAYSFWFEQHARRPNDDEDPTTRTVMFDAHVLDAFQTGLRTLAPALERISHSVRSRPHLHLIQGGRS